MNRTPVESSSIAEIGWEKDTETLEILFKSGASYQYAGVTQFTHDQFMAASSKGYHFQAYIAPCFEYIRLHVAGCRKAHGEGCDRAGCPCWCHRERHDYTKAQEEKKRAEEESLVPKLKASIKQARKRRAAV